MKIEVSGQHVEITDALRDYAYKKIEKIYRLFNQITYIHVILEVDQKHPKQYQTAKAHVDLSQGELYAQSESDNLYAAIDVLSDKLSAQVIKHKAKLQKRDVSLRDLGDDLTGTDQ